MWEAIAKYWVLWVCALIAGGITFWAKHYIKLEKKANEERWKEKEKNMCGKIIEKIETEISEVEIKSQQEDDKIVEQLNSISKTLKAITAGLLSTQGKQFRDYCYFLLNPEHIITVDEFEQFTVDYDSYKELGGNHQGDTLHDAVIIKFNAQISK